MALVVIKLRQRSWSSTPTLFATLSKNIPAEIPIFAIRAAGAQGSWLGKEFALDAVLHHQQCGASLRQEAGGHWKAESDIVRDYEDETRGDRLGRMFGDEKRITGEGSVFLRYFPKYRTSFS